MNEEAAFLAAIREAPHDATARLVYADWLQDRGDPRAELVRIEEEMARLPVYSDEYWQLKPRRNELRGQAAPEWLEAMRYGTDVQPMFGHGIPEGWKERWRIIREFTDRWCRRPLPDVGGRLDEVRETEDRLGRTLPPSVREWVAFAHDVRRVPQDRHVIRDVYQMEPLPDHPVLSLLHRAEGNYHWTVWHEDLGEPDPPVYGFLWHQGQNDETKFVPERQEPIDPTVSEFVMRYAIGPLEAEGGGFAAVIADPSQLQRDLNNEFPLQCQFGATVIYEAENILVRLSPSPLGTGKFLKVEIARPLPPEAIPAFLWEEYCRDGTRLHGLFAEDFLGRTTYQ